MVRAAGIALAFTISLLGCGAEKADDVVSIVLSGRACATCVDGAVIKRDGTISSTTSGVPQVIDPRDAGVILGGLPLEELRSAERAPSAVANEVGIGVWIAYHDGTHNYAVVPVGQMAPTGIFALQRWVQTASVLATESLLGARRRAIYDALRRRTLRGVELDIVGCYGFCPRYSARFDADGVATIHETGPRCNVTANTHISFDLIINAASQAPASLLMPDYPTVAVDTLAARRQSTRLSEPSSVTVPTA